MKYVEEISSFPKAPHEDVKDPEKYVKIIDVNFFLLKCNLASTKLVVTILGFIFVPLIDNNMGNFTQYS